MKVWKPLYWYHKPTHVVEASIRRVFGAKSNVGQPLKIHECTTIGDLTFRKGYHDAPGGKISGKSRKSWGVGGKARRWILCRWKVPLWDVSWQMSNFLPSSGWKLVCFKLIKFEEISHPISSEFSRGRV